MPGAKIRSAIKTLAIPALLLVIAVALLRASGGPAAADAIPGAAPPVIEDGPDARTVRNAEARLRVYDAATDDAIRVFATAALDSLTGDRNTVQRASDALAVRSPRDFTLAPVQADETLIERIDESGRVQSGFGQVQVPARAFIESIGGVRYTLARGGGKLQRRIGYRGLPYTAVLDRAHRIAEVIHGFGDDLDDLERAIDAVLAQSQAPQQ